MLMMCDFKANTHKSPSQFVAQVTMSSRMPSLVLEDMENHFDEIQCYNSSVYLYFSKVETLKHAHEELNRVERFVLITSHDGCNKDGEREPHMLACTYDVTPKNGLLISTGFSRLRSMKKNSF